MTTLRRCARVSMHEFVYVSSSCKFKNRRPQNHDVRWVYCTATDGVTKNDSFVADLYHYLDELQYKYNILRILLCMRIASQVNKTQEPTYSDA